MNDRELLESAARVAGIDLTDALWSGKTFVFRAPRTPNWNPLIDDGDAMRLAVKLGLTIDFNAGTVRKPNGALLAVSETDIRIAIVRAAATMAKTTA